MKFLLILFAAAIVTYFFQACDGKNKSHNKEPNKTENTFVTYIHYFNPDPRSPVNDDIRDSRAVRVIVDTFKSIIVDSSNGQEVHEKKWAKDTFYAVRVWDSARDQKTGKVLLDSAGKPKLMGWDWRELRKFALLTDHNKPW